MKNSYKEGCDELIKRYKIYFDDPRSIILYHKDIVYILTMSVLDYVASTMSWQWEEYCTNTDNALLKLNAFST